MLFHRAVNPLSRPARRFLEHRNSLSRLLKSPLQPHRRWIHVMPVLGPPTPPLPGLPVETKGVVGRVIDRFSPFSQKDRVYQAEVFFQAATHQANNPHWYGPGRIGRDFRSRHAILTMHIWLLHKRLLHDEVDKERGLIVQEELFNILWEDTICRIRREGVNELLVNKNLLKVQQYTFLHLTHYDHVYTEFLDQPEDRLKELRKLVWQHLFCREESAEHRTEHLDRFAWYVDASYRNMMNDWPYEYYREGLVSWVNLPDFSRMKDANGKVMEEVGIDPEEVLPKPWLQNITLRGKMYYWNPHTNETTWERPV